MDIYMHTYNPNSKRSKVCLYLLSFFALVLSKPVIRPLTYRKSVLKKNPNIPAMMPTLTELLLFMENKVVYDLHTLPELPLVKPIYNQRKPAAIKPFHDLREPVAVEPFHDQREPVAVEPFHDQHEPVAVEPFHDQREPVAVEPFHDQRKPVAVEPFHDQRKPIAVEPFHDQRKPIAVEPFHDQHGPVEIDQNHDLRKPVINDESQDLQVPIGNHMIEVNNFVHEIAPSVTLEKDILHSQSVDSLLSESKLNSVIYSSPIDSISLLISYLAQNNIGNLSVKLNENLNDHSMETKIENLVSYSSEMKQVLVENSYSQLSQSALSNFNNDGNEDVVSETKYESACGISKGFSMARIVGGKVSVYLKWPWMISLRLLEDGTFKHKCSAVLLNRLWVITVAHCVDKKPRSEIMLHLGDYNIYDTDEVFPHIEMRVLLIVLHPNFDPLTYENDIALLRFYHSAPQLPNIFPVCLPTSVSESHSKVAVVTGWGRLSEDGTLPAYLHEVHLPIISSTVCEKMYYDAGFVETIHDVFICAGFESGGLDACEGDSGGPMVIKEKDGHWSLIGLISWGIGCGAPKRPGVYVRISKYVDWIENIIAI